jgi:DNA-directed RNA polymerase specialized sigma subunit
MESAYEAWKQKPTEINFDAVLDKAEPVINSALQSYAGGDKTLHTKAQLLTARAIKSFDSTKGTKLRTHVMTQLQPLSRVYRERTQLISVPERVTTDLYKMKQEEQRFKDQFGRPPADSELTSATGLSRRRLAHIRKFSARETAESSLVGDEGEVLYPGVSAPDPEQILIEYVHHDLEPLDQMILEFRSGLHGKPVLSNNEIATRLKLSPGAVSQRAAKIAARITDLQNQGVS